MDEREFIGELGGDQLRGRVEGLGIDGRCGVSVSDLQDLWGDVERLGLKK